MGDVLGFSNIISNLTEIELEKRIKNIATLVEEAARSAGIPTTHFQLMSDTILAYTPNTLEGLKTLIKFSQFLLNTGIKNSIPIRGAISFGNLKWNDSSPTIYGKAVINAHSLEKNQEWIGVICNPEIPFSQHILNDNSYELVCYPTPLKKGLIQLHPAVYWDVPSTENLSKCLCAEGLSKEGEHLKWEHFGHKIQNTILFGLYLKIIKQKSLHPGNFHGHLPIESIQLALSY